MPELGIDWKARQGPLAVDDGRIAVVRVETRRLPPGSADRLAPFERERLARTRRADAASAYLAQRAWVHRLLAETLGIPVAELMLRRTGKGKPGIAAPDTDLEFNLSHTRGLALLALARGIPIGIDVEALRPVGRRDAIACRIFGRTDMTEEEFFTNWTRLEASQKALGRGLFEPHATPDEVRVVSFSPAVGHVAALAYPVSAEAVEVDFHDT